MIKHFIRHFNIRNLSFLFYHFAQSFAIFDDHAFCHSYLACLRVHACFRSHHVTSLNSYWRLGNLDNEPTDHPSVTPLTALVNSSISLFGVPATIWMDQVAEFESIIFNEIQWLLGSHQFRAQLTTAPHSQDVTYTIKNGRKSKQYFGDFWYELTVEIDKILPQLIQRGGCLKWTKVELSPIPCPVHSIRIPGYQLGTHQ